MLQSSSFVPTRHHRVSAVGSRAVLTPSNNSHRIRSRRQASPPQAAAAPPNPHSAQQPADTEQQSYALATSSISKRQLLSLAGCACCLQLLEASSQIQPAAASGGAQPFSYSQPSAWPGTCSSGTQQSPINLTLQQTAACDVRPPPVFKYRSNTNLSIKNTGTTLQVNFAPTATTGDNNNNSASWAGQQLQLLQFHFHTPSEHTVEGAHTAMEAHLVHRNVQTGGLAVMAVLLEAPTAAASSAQQQQQPLPNPALAAGLAAVPDTPGATATSATPINPADLLPTEPSALQQYIAYRGSLTTPPCSEGVDWLVWTQPLLVPQQQVDAFRRFAGGANARPLQPLNSRAVVAYNNCLSTV